MPTSQHKGEWKFFLKERMKNIHVQQAGHPH
jgi:hypothetical protein